MNVAEHIRSAWAVESHFLLRSCLIKSEVKSFPAVKRKHTVKPWIEIREIDNAPRGYNQQVGFERLAEGDRKSTRLNSSHSQISYAVFCLKNTNIRRTAVS